MYSRVYIEITNICNMSCSFCHGHNRSKRFMTADEFEHILHSLKGRTKYIYYHLMGEPLLHPLLPVFLKKANEMGFRSVITTNGTLLKKRGDELLSCGVHKINISLHSFEGDDENAREAYLNEIIRFCHSASKAGIIVVLRLWNKGFDGGGNDKITELLKNSLEGEWAENTKGLRIRNKLHIEWGNRFEWPDKSAPIQGDEVFCYGLRDHFGILCDGTVVPCCLDSDGTINLGNIFTQNIGSILSSPKAQAMCEGFENRKAVMDLCRRCGYARRFV